MNPGDRDQVWILDVNGQRLVIQARESQGGRAGPGRGAGRPRLTSLRAHQGDHERGAMTG